MLLYDGITWYERSNGYFYNVNGEGIHRYIWEQANGSIPKGWEIHHKDLDPTNNDLPNLQCLTKSEHSRIHFNIKYAEGCFGGKSRLGSTHTKSTKLQMRSNHNPKSNLKHRRKVVCVETGELFASLKCAGDSVGCCPSGICEALSTKSSRKTCGGYHWKYYRNK